MPEDSGFEENSNLRLSMPYLDASGDSSLQPLITQESIWT